MIPDTTLPRFLDRVIDATIPTLGGLNRKAVVERLRRASITLRIASNAAEGAGAGFLLAANLAARLYPLIRLDAQPALVAEAAALVVQINPMADVRATRGDDVTSVTVGLGDVDDADVIVSASGWNVFVDSVPDTEETAAVPAWLVAAALGVGEAFRVLLASDLGARARRSPQPAAFNLVTLGGPESGLPTATTGLNLGRFRLVGCGAIGQAASQALALSRVVGTMTAVDPEQLTLSNLQRYVLAGDRDVGSSKVELLAERLAGSALEVEPVPVEWSVDIASEQLPTLVALDSADARIGVQAGLPGPIYNAWTQPADLGWSRHERFGQEPCLACLYWPDRQQPSRHHQVATALGEHPLRILSYLVHSSVPIGLPLPLGAIPELPELPPPPDAVRWMHVPLVDDLAAAAQISASDLDVWRDRPLADVYQDGICGGALLYLNLGPAPQEVVVPLAHQSALAGILLATQFIVATVEELRAARPEAIEARLDVLAGLPQVMARPRARNPGCFCGDSVFREVYRVKVDRQH